jgi:mannose-6-phosphate isomerase-like protein (cupin superfamily)
MNLRKLAQPLSGQILGSVDGAFVIAEWQDPGGPVGPPRLIAPLHIHYSDDEAWYVLESVICIKVADEEIEVPAGSSVYVPRNTPHTYWNPGPNPVRYLLIMTPNIFRLIEDIHSTSDRSAPALQTLFRKYNSELLSD